MPPSVIPNAKEQMTLAQMQQALERLQAEKEEQARELERIKEAQAADRERGKVKFGHLKARTLPRSDVEKWLTAKLPATMFFTNWRRARDTFRVSIIPARVKSTNPLDGFVDRVPTLWMRFKPWWGAGYDFLAEPDFEGRRPVINPWRRIGVWDARDREQGKYITITEEQAVHLWPELDENEARLRTRTGSYDLEGPNGLLPMIERCRAYQEGEILSASDFQLQMLADYQVRWKREEMEKELSDKASFMRPGARKTGALSLGLKKAA